MRVYAVPIQYSHGRALTPNDVPDDNSKLRGASFIHCKTGAGLVTVTQAVTADGQAGIAPTALTTYQFYIGLGDYVAVGASWRNVNATGTAATGLTALH